jgi:hypothetical protein
MEDGFSFVGWDELVQTVKNISEYYINGNAYNLSQFMASVNMKLC